MKRNELLAKSLTLGLAVATAATSMSVPGGLLAPETVYAEETGTEGASGSSAGEATGADGSQSEGKVILTEANVTDYFRLMSDYVAIPKSEDAKVIWGYSLKHANDGATYVGTPTFTLKNENDEVADLSQLKSETTYTVYVSVTGGSGVEDTTSVKLGTVTAYTEFADALTYKNGADGDGITSISGKYFTKDVYVSAGDGATVGRSVAELGETYKEAYPVDYFTNADNQSKDTAGSGVTLLIQKAGKIYIKEVMINFTRTPEISDFSVSGDSVKDVSATLSVTFNKAGKAYYVVKTDEAADITAEQIKSDNDKKDVNALTADTAQQIAVDSLKANTSYHVYIAAEDSYENLSDVQHVTFTTAKTAIAGNAKLIGDATIGSELTASVEDGAEGVSYKYEFVRVAADQTETTVQAASENASYTITKEDKGSQIKVIVTADDYSGTLEESTANVTAVKVTEDKVKDYVDYTDITEGLIYNGEDQTDSVGKTVKIKEKYADEIELSDFYLTKSSETQKAEFIGAGTYDVYVALAGNYETDKPVKIGTATIARYETKASAIKVEGNKSTYYGGTVLYKNMDVTDPLKKGQFVTLTYKQIKDGNGNAVDKEASEAAPVNAGTYDIYAAYTKDPNCTALDATKTGAQIVITKADKKVTAGQLVVNRGDDKEQSIDLKAIVKELTCSGVDQTITADVTSEDDYFAADSLKYADGVIKVKLDTAKTGNLPDNTKATIHVDFGNSFNNYKVAFDIPVVITTKTVANITIANATNGILGTYGKVPEQLTFTISGVEDLDLREKTDAEIASACLKKYGDSNWAFGCTIHNQNGEEVKSIENAGTYSVHVTYWDSTCYGEITDVIVVKPKEIGQAADFSGILSLGKASLAYNFENQCDAIKKLVQLDAEDGVGSGDYDVVIKKGDSETEDASDAGSYGVYIAFNHGNYTTSGKLVQLGTVDIAKNKDVITLDVAKDGTPIVKVGSRTIPNEELQQILYVDKNGKESKVKPTAAGKYKVKVSYTNSNLENKLEGAEKEFTITSGGSSGSSSSGGSTSGGSSAGGGAATTPSKDDTKKDDTKKDTTTKTETKPDGTKVTTTETKAADGSVQTKIELKNDTAGVDATVNVAKDAQGKVTGVTADVNQTATDKQTAISAATVAQITAAAGTKDVEITTKTVDANGKTVREVTVNASDLTAGKKLKVVAVDPKTGEKTLVNKTTYKVAADGSLALDNLGNDSYEVVTTAEANALTKEILQSIRPERSKANIAAGKKTKLSLDDALNMDNVAKITYKTSKKSVATVNPNGTVTARKEGKVTIKAIVTLNNGKKKTVRMNLTVKARK